MSESETVHGPGSSWTKRKKKGRRAPMGDGVYLHRLTPRTTLANRHERRKAAALQRKGKTE